MSRLDEDLTYPYNLLKDISPDIFLMHTDEKMEPCDFVGSMEYVICLLEPQEREIIRLRYQQRMTYQGIGDLMELSRERVRQVILKAQYKMRHPSRFKYIRYGVKGVEKMMFHEALQSISQKETRAENTSVMEIELENLGLSVRSFNCLARAGVKNVADIIDLGDGLFCVRNLGKKGCKEIIDRLRELGVDCAALQQKLYSNCKGVSGAGVYLGGFL